MSSSLARPRSILALLLLPALLAAQEAEDRTLLSWKEMRAIITDGATRAREAGVARPEAVISSRRCSDTGRE